MKIKIKLPKYESFGAFMRGMLDGLANFGGFIVRILKWPALIALPLFVFAVAVWWSLISSLSSDVKEVPDVIDLLPQQAMERLAVRSLKLEVEEQRKHSDIYAEGRILAQNPPPGAHIKRGRTVRVTLSAGFRQVLVPNLVGTSLREARLIAEQKGFQLRRRQTAYSDRVQEGFVIAQSPLPSTPYITEFIDVLESRGARPQLMMLPRLVGRPLLPVLDALRDQGLRVIVMRQGSIQDISGGDRFELRRYEIYRQSPEAGEFITIPGSEEVILRVRWSER
jgi:beta-lactam-binding protein with PASTA domain